MRKLPNKRKEMGLRLAEVRKDLGLSQKDLGAKLDVPWRTYQNYEAGIREITASLLSLFYTELNVDPLWILSGEGRRFVVNEFETLKTVIQQVELVDRKINFDISPVKKADLITKVYTRALEGKAIPDEDLEDWFELAK